MKSCSFLLLIPNVFGETKCNIGMVLVISVYFSRRGREMETERVIRPRYTTPNDIFRQ